MNQHAHPHPVLSGHPSPNLGEGMGVRVRGTKGEGEKYFDEGVEK